MENLIQEIEDCRGKNCYLAALSLALIIPNVCASYGKGGSNGIEYAAWCKKWLDPFWELDGNLVYSIRCAILHAMNFELNGSSFNRYKDDQLKAGETRKQKFELYIPHDGTEKPVVRLFENDATISHTICVNILISALIEGYKNYKRSNPEFKHDFSHIWFEG